MHKTFLRFVYRCLIAGIFNLPMDIGGLNIVYAQVTQEWVSRYNGPGNSEDLARKIAVDGAGNVYVTGTSGDSSTDQDYATIKYDSAGVQQWVARYNGPVNYDDGAHSIAVDGAGNVYVTGGSWGNGHYDYATIKYSQTFGITPISTEIPAEFKLYQNYPNPFNAKTSISFQLAGSSFTSLKVYDILGREVTELVNEKLRPGTYKVTWDASNYPSGVYI